MEQSTFVGLRFPTWMADTMLGDVENRSARIIELVSKGYLYELEIEKQKLLKGKEKSELHHAPVVYSEPVFADYLSLPCSVQGWVL